MSHIMNKWTSIPGYRLLSAGILYTILNPHTSTSPQQKYILNTCLCFNLNKTTKTEQYCRN